MNVCKMVVCPVCGKPPKVKKTLTGKTIIQCKPFLKNAHMRIETPYADFLNPKSKALGAWNASVSNNKKGKYYA